MLLLGLPLLWPTPLVGDNFQFWVAGRMVVSGVSPYDRASWVAAAAYGAVPGGVAVNTAGLNLAITQQVWLYPPQTAFLFAPFGALPLEIGVPLLHLFILITTFAGIALAASFSGLRGAALGLVLALAILSETFVIPVRNGHPIGLLLIGGVLLLRGVAVRDLRAVALGTALLTLKPQLVLPLAVAAVAYAAARKDQRALTVMAVSAIAVTLPFELLTPFPIGALFESGAERLRVDLSTLPALARDLGDGTALAVGLAALMISLCALSLAWVPREWRGRVAAGSLFALSPALVPYTHDYDLLFGVPAVFVAVALAVAQGRRRIGLLIGSVALSFAPWLLFYWWPLTGDGSRRFLGGPLGAVPLVFALALAAVALITRAAEPQLDAADRTPHPPQREMA